MKKFFAVMGIIAGVLLGLGVIVGTIGLVGGGFSSVKTAFLNNEFTWQPFETIHTVSWEWSDDDFVTFLDDYEKYSDGTYSFDQEEGTENLEISVGGGEVYVEQTDDEQITIEISNDGRMQCYQKNGTLYIKGAMKSGFNGCTMKVYMPKSMQFKDYLVELGAGTVEIDEVIATKMDLDIGAGTLEVKKLVCDDVEVEMGAGEIDLYGMEVGELDCAIGMGDACMEGIVNGNVSIECAMGSATLMLEGNQKDFNYGVECSMGDIVLGTNSYSGAATEQNIDNGADKEMNLSCSMGSISVSFE